MSCSSSFARALLALVVLAPAISSSVTVPSASPLIISEFRLRGPSGANDEFVEIYNPSATATTVQTTDGSAGFAVAPSDGVIRFTIPNGTVIPAGGHYLGANSVAYSLSGYPASSARTATGDATWTTDIPDNAGLALFNTANTANFNLTNRLDAVGSTSEANTLYKEGTGYTALTPFSIDYSFARRVPGAGAFTSTACLAQDSGLAQDTGDNAGDFLFYDTNGTSAGAGQRLGAPAPQNLASPLVGGGLHRSALIDPGAAVSAGPNVVRDLTSDPANNSFFGTISIRRHFTNTTGQPITRLRFRVVEMNTFPAPSGYADLRTRTSSNSTALLSDSSTITVYGTTMEQPPSQPNGGAYNASYFVPSVTSGTPLAAGQSIDVQFLMGIQQAGKFRFFIEAEADVAPALASWGVIGSTEALTPASWTDCGLIATTTTVTSSAQTVQLGASLTLTTTVTAASGTPTGNVTFKDTTTNTSLGTAALDASGVATVTASFQSVGTHSIEASYTGVGDYASSKGQVSPPVTVTKRTTATTLALSAASVDMGQSVTFTATVDNGTGEVIFKDGTTELGRGTLAAGTATFSTDTLAAGLYSVTATYAGDDTFATSTSTATDLRVRSTTTLHLEASSSPVVVGDDIALTALTSATSGTIDIYEGVLVVGSGSITPLPGPVPGFSMANVVLKGMPEGTHLFYAKFAGSETESEATSTFTTVLVAATTTTTLTVSAPSAPLGSSVTLTAKVVASAGVAQGQVTFSADGQVLATLILDGNGEASFVMTLSSAGTFQLTAKYLGAMGIMSSESSAVPVQTLVSTMTALTLQETALLGEAVVLTAHVTSQSGVPTGTVEFREDGTLYCTGTLDPAGEATCSTTALSRGSHKMVALYFGEGAYLASTSKTATITVSTPTTTTLTTSAQPGELTLTATVASADAPVTGEVEFFNGETSLGKVTLDTQGVATQKVTITAAATYTVTARYTGVDSFVSSASEAKTVNVEGPKPIDSSPVDPAAKKDTGCGCSSGSTDSMLLSLLGLVMLRARRRRA